MKKYLSILFIFSTVTLFSQNKTDFEAYFIKNNASKLIQSFAPTIDLDIPTTKSSFSKNQAAVITRSFFKENPPTSYKANHRGGGNGRAHYEIGVLRSSESKYRTYLLYEMSEDMIQIIELRIEPED